jgi:polyphenol oxidase
MDSFVRPYEEQGAQRFVSPTDSTNPQFDTSRLLEQAGFTHAFFTRVGGVSKFPLDSLNLAARSTGDDPVAVEENFRRCARTLGVGLEKLYILSQVHGTRAVLLSGAENRDDVSLQEGDITASTVSGVACGVRSADCVCVLLGDRKTGAVTAVHSGWVGTVANAVGAGVDVLRSLASSADIVAAIGPHIEQCCFEVGDDVAERLAKCSSLGTAAVDRSRAKPHVNLRRLIRAQLVAAGVDDGCIDDVFGCTVCRADRYFSYRRDAQRSGRMLAAIVARAASLQPVLADEQNLSCSP